MLMKRTTRAAGHRFDEDFFVDLHLKSESRNITISLRDMRWVWTLHFSLNVRHDLALNGAAL